jgi:hypothetical protein
MDLSKKVTDFTNDRIQQFKEGLKMIPVLIWLVLSRIIFLTGFSVLINFGFLIWYFFSRETPLVWYSIGLPILISIGMVALMFMVARSYGIECAIEYAWNQKKHLIFDIIANKTTAYLSNKKLPLTSESTWKWLSEKPQEIVNSLPFVLRLIVQYIFNKIPLASHFGKMVQLKSQLSEDPQQAALVLSGELQKGVNPEIVQSSFLKIAIVLIVNIGIFVSINYLFS